MKVTVIGPSDMLVLLSQYLPEGTDEILTRGKRGVEAMAKLYAEQNGIPCREFLPDYLRHGAKASRRRDDLLISETEWLIAFWNGKSLNTKYVIDGCLSAGKTVKVYGRGGGICRLI